MTDSQPVSRRTIIAAAFGAVAASAASSRRASALSDGPPPFETARHQFTILRPARVVPPVPIVRLDGTTANFSATRGKVVLVNFWATWCAACKTELPQLDRLQQMADRTTLQVMAIALDRGGRSAVAPFVQRANLRHLDIYLDPQGLIGRANDGDEMGVPFNLYGMPISYVIDQSGRITGYLAGAADWTSSEAQNLLGYYAAGGT